MSRGRNLLAQALLVSAADPEEQREIDPARHPELNVRLNQPVQNTQAGMLIWGVGGGGGSAPSVREAGFELEAVCLVEQARAEEHLRKRKAKAPPKPYEGSGKAKGVVLPAGLAGGRPSHSVPDAPSQSQGAAQHAAHRG